MIRFLFLLCIVNSALFAQDVTFRIFIEKQDYIIGERVFINLVIFNNSSDTIHCADFPSYFKEYYTFNFKDSKGKQVEQPEIMLSSYSPVKLAPNSFINRVLDVTYRFANKGRDVPDQPITSYMSYGLLPEAYTFQVDYLFATKPDTPEQKVYKLSSNTVSFNLLPITKPVDSLVAATMLAHNNLNYKNKIDYRNALDSSITIGRMSGFYSMLIHEKLLHANISMNRDAKANTTFWEILDELVRIAPNSQYAAEAFSISKRRNIPSEKATYYEQLLKDNVFLNPTLNGKDGE